MNVRPFISYAREDQAAALKLHRQLVRAGTEPWVDVLNLQGGQDWELTIAAALRESTHVIVLLSRHSLTKRGFVQKEIRKALELLDEFPPNSIYVLPVRLDHTEPVDDRLRRLQWINLFPDFDAAFVAILRSLNVASRETRDQRMVGVDQPLNRSINRESIGSFIAENPIVAELDCAIAARTRRNISKGGILTGLQSNLVVGLADVGIYKTVELEEALVVHRHEILALTQEYIGSAGGDELGMGICVNYLQYVLVGESGSLERILRYYNVLGTGFGEEQRRTFAMKLLQAAVKLQLIK